jgi:hypothetical protein
VNETPLIVSIKNAFSSRKTPEETIDLLEGGRDYSRCPDAAHFKGRRWDDISLDELNQYSDSIHEFNIEAFCYYLPAILLSYIYHPDQINVQVCYLINFLDSDYDYNMWDDFVRRRICALNIGELNAIDRWIDFLAANEYSFGWHNTYDKIKNCIATASVLLELGGQ